jgi:cytochrome c nitrite reductase small subunit
MSVFSKSGRKKLVLPGVAVAVLVLVSAFLLVGPPRLLAKSDTAGFCAGCHVMEGEYDAFMHTGAHRRKQCSDCHLPNSNAVIHYTWKTIDGLKDALVFYSGRVPERIRLSEHGAKVLQANCIRCHGETVSMINTERKCWSCHRSITHTRAGAIETL